MYWNATVFLGSFQGDVRRLFFFQAFSAAGDEPDQRQHTADSKYGTANYPQPGEGLEGVTFNEVMAACKP